MKDIIINGKTLTNVSKLYFNTDEGKQVCFIEESELSAEISTSASLFAFEGSSITAYYGDEMDIVLPTSYSLGSVELVNRSFDSVNSMQSYYDKNSGNFTFPLTIIDANGDEFVLDNGVWELYNLNVSYPISISIMEQLYIDGDDYLVDTIASNAFSQNSVVRNVKIQDL